MKKALLPAIISALFATGAQAANLYEADGTTVALTGEVDAIFTTTDSDSGDEDGLVYSWANVQFDISTQVSESVTAIASFEVEGSDSEEFKVDDAWLGFTGDFGTIKMGETGSAFAVIEKAELINEGDEYSYVYTDAEGDGRSILYSKVIGPVTLAANYAFESDSADDTIAINDAGDDVIIEEGTVSDDNFAVSADFSMDELTVGVGYLNGGDDVESMGISAAYEADALYLAATYTFNTVSSDSEDDFSTAAVSASYTIADLATVYGSYQINDGDNRDLTYYYAGVARDITANVYGFVEYTTAENDQADTDTSTLYAGVYYSF